MAIALFLVNYYSVSLAEQISATSLGSAFALCIIAALIGFIVKTLTKNNMIALGVGGGLIVLTLAAYSVLCMGLILLLLAKGEEGKRRRPSARTSSA